MVGNKLQRKHELRVGPTHSTGTKLGCITQRHTSFWGTYTPSRIKEGYNISKQIFQHARSFPKGCATAFDSLCTGQQ